MLQEHDSYRSILVIERFGAQRHDGRAVDVGNKFLNGGGDRATYLFADAGYKPAGFASRSSNLEQRTSMRRSKCSPNKSLVSTLLFDFTDKTFFAGGVDTGYFKGRAPARAGGCQFESGFHLLRLK